MSDPVATVDNTTNARRDPAAMMEIREIRGDPLDDPILGPIIRRQTAPRPEPRFDCCSDGPWPRADAEILREWERLNTLLGGYVPIPVTAPETLGELQRYILGAVRAAKWTLGLPLVKGDPRSLPIPLSTVRAVIDTNVHTERTTPRQRDYCQGDNAWLRWITNLAPSITYPEGELPW